MLSLIEPLLTEAGWRCDRIRGFSKCFTEGNRYPKDNRWRSEREQADFDMCLRCVKVEKYLMNCEKVAKMQK